MGDSPMAFVTFDEQVVSDRQRQWACRKGTKGAVALSSEAYPIAEFSSLVSHFTLLIQTTYIRICNNFQQKYAKSMRKKLSVANHKL